MAKFFKTAFMALSFHHCGLEPCSSHSQSCDTNQVLPADDQVVFLRHLPFLPYLLIDLSQNKLNQSRTNGPINAHLTIAQVMPKYNHNNEKQLEALL